MLRKSFQQDINMMKEKKKQFHNIFAYGISSYLCLFKRLLRINGFALKDSLRNVSKSQYYYFLHTWCYYFSPFCVCISHLYNPDLHIIILFSWRSDNAFNNKKKEEFKYILEWISYFDLITWNLLVEDFFKDRKNSHFLLFSFSFSFLRTADVFTCVRIFFPPSNFFFLTSFYSYFYSLPTYHFIWKINVYILSLFIVIE